MVNIRGRKLINFGLVAVDIVVAGAFAANIVITHAAKGKTYSDVTLIPHQRVGLVLGSPKRVADGRLNLFFRAPSQRKPSTQNQFSLLKSNLVGRAAFGLTSVVTP